MNSERFSTSGYYTIWRGSKAIAIVNDALMFYVWSLVTFSVPCCTSEHLNCNISRLAPHSSPATSGQDTSSASPVQVQKYTRSLEVELPHESSFPSVGPSSVGLSHYNYIHRLNKCSTSRCRFRF